MALQQIFVENSCENDLYHDWMTVVHSFLDFGTLVSTVNASRVHQSHVWRDLVEAFGLRAVLKFNLNGLRVDFTPPPAEGAFMCSRRMIFDTVSSTSMNN